MTTFVRHHSEASSAVTGSSIATSLAATVPAGDTLFAIVTQTGGVSGSAEPASLSVPGGESAAWTLLGEADGNNAAATLRSGISLWGIVTTVPWSSGYTVTASWGAASLDSRSISLSEIQGPSLTIIDADTSSANETTSAVRTLSVDGVQAGDVVLEVAVIFGGSLTIASSGTATSTTHSMVGSTSIGFSVRRYGTAHVITGSGGRTAEYTPSDASQRVFVTAALRAINYTPNAPTLTSMADGGTVNRGITQRASHVFSDPVTSDSQSKFDLRYRLIGAPTWTTVTQTTPNQFYDFPAGSLAAGDYERQVRTYDSIGVVGPYSTSGFFTAADAPDGPTITDPVNAETIILPTNAFTWSAPDQDAYQVRKVADDALDPGTPDTAVVYYDSGEIIDTTTRTVQLDFPVNGRTEHLQVRVKFDDLWSEWASIVVDVDYSPPPTPTVELSTDIATGSLLVTITNPAPTGEDPAASYNDVYVDDGNGEERRATAVPPNTSWRYWLPVSGRDYSTAIRVVAVASSGATASSV